MLFGTVRDNYFVLVDRCMVSGLVLLDCPFWHLQAIICPHYRDRRCRGLHCRCSVWVGGTGAGQAGRLRRSSAVIRAEAAAFRTLPINDMLAMALPRFRSGVSGLESLGNGESCGFGLVQPNGPDGYLVRFQLFDVFTERLFTDTASTTGNRTTAHRIADLIYETLTREKGLFPPDCIC